MNEALPTMEVLMPLADVRALIQLSDRAARRWVSAGKIPKPDYKLAGRFPRWRRSTIETWLGEQSTT